MRTASRSSIAAVARKVADLVETARARISGLRRTTPSGPRKLGLPAGTTRRNDTLDVWIDSGVSHTAVIARRARNSAAAAADLYLEATDQHRGWFQSSLMTSDRDVPARAPYKTVITHGFVVDKDTRKKVSKSEQGTYAKPMNAEHFVGKYGADIVRLWAASVDYQNEVPFSEEVFKRLAEAYRSFRNILRILLANLRDFEPRRRVARTARRSIDRWVLSRLQEVIATCREAYAAYDFRKVFQTLNQFVRRRYQRALRRHHQGPHVLRRREFAAPPRHADRDAPRLRCPRAAARADPRLHRG